jgi:transposase
MNLKKIKHKNGRTYLSIVKSYRNPDTKVSTGKTVLSLGYLDVLEKEYSDPIAHFKEVARQMTADDRARGRVKIDVALDERLPDKADGMKNFGYAVPMRVYHELGIDEFLKAKMIREKFDFNTNSIMILLLVSRILYPGSKKKAFEGKGRFFERFDFTLDDVYRALTHFDKVSEELQRFIHGRVKERYGCDTSVVYYDVTNYYFEISKPDELRKYTKNAKQNRKKPVVQMGLALDKNGIPIHYELFPGNKLDKETFRSVIGEVRKTYDTGRIIVVADMGIITGDNIYYLVGSRPEKPRNGYVFSFSVRGGTDELKRYVLDEEGYGYKENDTDTKELLFKRKSRRIRREINVTMISGRKQKTQHVYEKQVVFWSYKYFKKARAERAEMIAKAEALVSDPGKYNKATSYGAAAYIENLKIDDETGEVTVQKDKKLAVNYDKIREDEKYDGYYAIVTSEHGMNDGEIVDTYRGLWEIEETFKITKSDLGARPAFVSDPDHIDAHFLTCFIALLILRIIQKETGKVYSVEQIIETLKKIQCMNEHENVYMFGFRDEIVIALEKAFKLDFARKRMLLSEIKNVLSNVKN